MTFHSRWRLVVVLAAAISGCPAPPSETLVLGGSISLTGDCGILDNLQSVDLAISEINDKGGVLGKKISLKNLDDHTDKAIAVANVKALAEEGLNVIIGGECSGLVRAMLDGHANANDILIISGAATSAELTAPAHNSNRVFYRTVPSDGLQGKLLAKHARAIGLDDVTAFYHLTDDAYTAGLSQSFVEWFQTLGGTARRVTFTHDDTQSETQFTDLLNANYPQSTKGGILVAGYATNAAALVKDSVASAPPPHPVQWMFPDALADPQFFQILSGSVFSSMTYFGTSPFIPEDARAAAFRDRFKSKYGVEPNRRYYNEYWYDATYVVALAIQAAGSSESAALKEAIPAIINGPGTSYGPEDFEAAVADLKAGKKIQYRGVTALKGMTPTGDLTTGAYDIWNFNAEGQPTPLPGLSNVEP